MAEASSRCAVVTGANRGIGLEVCKQLASNGVKVVLTARDENRGLRAVRRIEEAGLSGRVVFHPLDVTDPASVASLADFINAKFGKLDILVNNAGVVGAKFRPATDDALRATGLGQEGAKINLEGLTIETQELAEECLDIVYYGAKRTVKALFPYLQLSDSPRIVLVSSYYGRLKNVSNEWAMRVLADKENLTEERVDEVLQVYLRDFKEGSLKTKGWPTLLSAYIVSKAALNAYARILAKKHPSFYVNSVCPGIVKTDMTLNMGILSVEEGAGSIVRLALMPNGGPSGCFFRRKGRDPILSRL